VGYTYGTMARTMRRYVEHELVEVAVGERNRKTYALKAEWRDIINANLPKISTYAVQLARHVEALNSRDCFLRHKGEDEKAEKVEKQLKHAESRLQKVKAAAGIVPFVAPPRLDQAGERLDRLRHAVATGERAEHRPKEQKLTEGDKWRRREYACDKAKVADNWDAFNAWATVQNGAPGWWVRMAETNIIGQYRVYEIIGETVPTVRWVGA
jgi:DNA-binding PadR family transcriptional regulator